MSNDILQLLFVITWVSGIILANGFWSTLFALCIPLWALYLVIEKIFNAIGVL